MDTTILKKIGLTDGELKVYVALTRLGEARKSLLAKESGVSSSKVYEICDRLEKKGLVGHILKKGIKHFVAMSPNCILDYFDKRSLEFQQQRDQLEKIIPQLSELKQGEKTSAVLFAGTRAIKNFYMNLLQELHRGDVYYVLGVNYGTNHPELRAFFESFHRQRAVKGIKVKMLINESNRHEVVSTVHKNSAVRFLPNYMFSNMIVLFYKAKTFIFFLTQDAVGFEINNAEVVKGFQSYFDAFWKLASD